MWLRVKSADLLQLYVLERICADSEQSLGEAYAKDSGVVDSKIDAENKMQPNLESSEVATASLSVRSDPDREHP